jgi:hypothetical protein
LPARLALNYLRTHRVRLMNQIGRAPNIPPGGWNYGQMRLFDKGDIRLADMGPVVARASATAASRTRRS